MRFTYQTFFYYLILVCSITEIYNFCQKLIPLKNGKKYSLESL